MSREEKINDAVNLLKKEFYKLGDSARYEENNRDHYFYFGNKSLELKRGIHSYEIMLFEDSKSDNYKILGTMKALESGLYFIEGRLTNLLDNKILFNSEVASEFIGNLK